MHIAVFLFSYPVLSETFVINELYQLQQRGVQGTIWREKIGNGLVHPKVGKTQFAIYDSPAKIFGPLAWQLFFTHIWWLLHQPVRYLFLLFEVVRYFPDRESLKIFLKAMIPAYQAQQRGAQVVYVHEDDRSFVFGLCTARLSGLPLIVIFHTYYLLVKRRYLMNKMRLASAIIFQSAYSKEFALKQLKSPAAIQKKAVVISSPGIDTNFFSPLKTTATRRNGKAIQLVSVGRLEEAKGFEHLLEAVQLLKKRYPNLHCTIVGEGSLRLDLEKQIRKRHLSRDVSLMGALPHNRELQDILRSAEIFILPSVQDKEGVHDVHPNALKEAMACGLIVITTRLGGVDEVISDGQDGFLIESADARHIADKVNEVLQLSVQQRQGIRVLARQKILQQFSDTQVTEQLFSFFSKYAT